MKTNESTTTLLAAVKGTTGRIGTAAGSVADVVSCGLGVCRRYFPNLAGAKLKRAAASQLVYTADDLLIEAASKQFDELAPSGIEVPKGSLMLLRPVVTTTKRDRDGDILETKGAVVSERTPLLWQHVATVPIGVRLATVEHSDDRLKFVSALLDLNDLTEDAAKLIEAGALSISHGFKSLKWSRLPGPDGREPQKGEHFGFRVHEFEIMEHSLVSVPSNTDAVITAYSRGNLRSELAKSWAKKHFDGRQVVGRGASVRIKTGEQELAIKVADAADVGEAVSDALAATKSACECRSVGESKSADYVVGSWEAIEQELSRTIRGYLENYGVKVTSEDRVWLCGTFPSHAFVCVQSYRTDLADHYKVAWMFDGSRPMWTGKPAEIQVVTVAGEAMEDEAMEDDEKAAPQKPIQVDAAKEIANENVEWKISPQAIDAKAVYAWLLSASESELGMVRELTRSFDRNTAAARDAALLNELFV